MDNEENKVVDAVDEVVITGPTPSVAEVMTSNNKESSEETVTVKASDLSEILARVKFLEEEQSLRDKVTDKNTIQRIEELRRSGKLVTSVKIRKAFGLFITGWATVDDEVYRDENGRVIEKQNIKIFFEDGTDRVVTLRQWASLPEYVPFEVTKKTVDDDGNTFYTAVGKDGREILIGEAFIN